MNQRIRIIFVIDFLDTNLAGTENQLIKLINGLDRAKFEVEMFCFRDMPWLQSNGVLLNCPKTIIPIQYFHRLVTYRNILGLIGIFRRSRPDIVHTFFPTSNILAVIAARLAGVGTIISSRRDYGEWMSKGYLAFTKLANRFVTKITTNSSSVKALTVSAEGVRPDKVAVIFNGIEAEPLKNLVAHQGTRQRLGIAAGNRAVGIVANFRPMKRHDTFVRAAQEVLKIRSDVDFLLIGGIEPLREQTKIFAQSLGIAHKLHFVGSQKDVGDYLAIMDVGVNCSEREGLSNAIMEYMAAGVPCVVADSGGNPDLIVNGVNGLTFPVGDYHALAHGILRLLDDDVLRQEYTSKARLKIDSELTVPAMLSAHERLYLHLVQRHERSCDT